MKNNFLVGVLVFIFLACNSEKKLVRIHVLGDSTTEQQNPNVKDQRGWPQLLPSFLTNKAEVLNHGKSGTSTKTFYQGIYWAKAKPTILKGDYVVIQFGHNDEKHNGLAGPCGTVATDSFRIYLRKYVNEVRQMGGIPIFMTPVVRRMLGSDGKVSRRGYHDLGQFASEKVDTSLNPQDTIGFNYPYNMRYVARELNCPLIDMTQLTRQLVNELGAEKSGRLIYNIGDGTHFAAGGAALFAQLAAKGLREQNLLTPYLIPDAHLIVQPFSIDFGTVTKDSLVTRVFDAGWINSERKNIKITASKGFLVSLFKDSVSFKKISIPYNGVDNMVFYKCRVQVRPSKTGDFAGKLIVSDGKSRRAIELKGICK